MSRIRLSILCVVARVLGVDFQFHGKFVPHDATKRASGRTSWTTSNPAEAISLWRKHVGKPNAKGNHHFIIEACVETTQSIERKTGGRIRGVPAAVPAAPQDGPKDAHPHHDHEAHHEGSGGNRKSHPKPSTGPVPRRGKSLDELMDGK